MDEGSERFEALETKAAYQEIALAKLNGEVWELSRKLDRLENLILDLRRKMDEAEQPSSNPPADQKPPHY